jgi:hypothetical protein
MGFVCPLNTTFIPTGSPTCAMVGPTSQGMPAAAEHPVCSEYWSAAETAEFFSPWQQTAQPPRIFQI